MRGKFAAAIVLVIASCGSGTGDSAGVSSQSTGGSSTTAPPVSTAAPVSTGPETSTSPNVVRCSPRPVAPLGLSRWPVVVALDPATGEVCWLVDDAIPNETHVVAARGDLVLVARRPCAEGESSLVALDAASGAQVWRVPFDWDQPAGAPVLGEGVVVIATSRDEFGAYDVRTGRMLWTKSGVPIAAGGGTVLSTDPAPQPPEATVAPTTVPGTASPATDPRLYALDTASGKERWAVMLAERPGPNSTFTDGDVVVVAQGRQGLIAYDAVDGTERWHAEVGPAVTTSSLMSPVATPIADGVLVGVEAAPGLVGVDTADGHMLWKTVTDEPPLAVLVDESAVVVGGFTKAEGRDPRTGRLLWSSPQIEVGAPSDLGAPGIGNGLIVEVDENTLSAFNLTSGTPRWTHDFRDVLTAHQDDAHIQGEPLAGLAGVYEGFWACGSD